MQNKTPGTVDQALACEVQQGLPSYPLNGAPAHRLLPIGWNAPLTSTPFKVSGRSRPGHSHLPKNEWVTAQLLAAATSQQKLVLIDPKEPGGTGSAQFTSGLGMK